MFRIWYILSVVKVYNAEFITIIAKASWIQHSGYSEVLERGVSINMQPTSQKFLNVQCN